MQYNRTITFQIHYFEGGSLTLAVDSLDGETADMTLLQGERPIATGEGFRVAQAGPHTWWDMPEREVLATFGSFFRYAIESTEDGAQDDWEFHDREAAEELAEAISYTIADED